MTNLELFMFSNRNKGGGTPEPSPPDVPYSDWVTLAELPSGTTAIPANAFNGFSNLRNVQLNNELSEIGVGAFFGCSKLDITINDSIIVGSNAFYDCQNVNIRANQKPSSYQLDENRKFYGCNNVTIIIPDGTRTIANQAFYNCNYMNNIIIPDTVTNIGQDAFTYCARLTSVTIPDSVTTIGTGIFSFCSQLVSATLSQNVKNITGTFYNCKRLTSVTLPNSVTTIGSGTFDSCIQLNSITMPNSIKNINANAFNKCYALENVVLENGFNANNLNLSASTNYSIATIVSILNALADRTGLAAYTLTLGSANLAKLSNEQIAIATEKNWTLA